MLISQRLTPVLMVIALVLAGCGQQQDPPTPTAIPPTIPQIDVLPPTPLPDEQQAGPTSTPVVIDPAVSGLPFEAVPEEVDAASRGPAVYSGFACFIAEGAGCSCEIPTLQQADFSYTQEGRLIFRFRGPGYQREWLMERVGINQWYHAGEFSSEEADITAGRRISLLSFTEEGYELTQVADVFVTGADGDSYIRCPAINFRMVTDDSTDEAPPTEAP